MDYSILVNSTHPIGETSAVLIPAADYSGKPLLVEQETYRAFCALRETMARQGIVIGLDSAYRSIAEQKQLIAELSAQYGEDYARRIAAAPGTSEHHTGLAVDIVICKDGAWITGNPELERETGIFESINNALPDHGFILRYPRGKEQITGIPWECWHIRYVGKALARHLTAEGLTLEEYRK